MESISPKLTAVIVTYQSAHTVEKTLQATKRCVDEGLLRCVIVDNGSTDGTITLLQQVGPWAEVILTGINNGFGRGCNIGFWKVTTPYTIFINPDAVVEPAAIRALLNFIDSHPDIGIVGPAIVEGDSSGPTQLQHAGKRPTPTYIVQAALRLADSGSLSRPIVPGSAPWVSEWVCGAVFLIRTDLMKHLGGFDPRFFLYWEETDICLRAERLGYSTWAVGEAIAHHVAGASSAADDRRIAGCIARFYYQSRFYYMVKHHGWIAASFAEGIEFLSLVATTMADLVRGRGPMRLKPRLETMPFSLPARF